MILSQLNFTLNENNDAGSWTEKLLSRISSTEYSKYITELTSDDISHLGPSSYVINILSTIIIFYYCYHHHHHHHHMTLVWNFGNVVTPEPFAESS